MRPADSPQRTKRLGFADLKLIALVEDKLAEIGGQLSTPPLMNILRLARFSGFQGPRV